MSPRHPARRCHAWPLRAALAVSWATLTTLAVLPALAPAAHALPNGFSTPAGPGFDRPPLLKLDATRYLAGDATGALGCATFNVANPSVSPSAPAGFLLVTPVRAHLSTATWWVRAEPTQSGPFSLTLRAFDCQSGAGAPRTFSLPQAGISLNLEVNPAYDPPVSASTAGAPDDRIVFVSRRVPNLEGERALYNAVFIVRPSATQADDLITRIDSRDHRDLLEPDEITGDLERLDGRHLRFERALPLPDGSLWLVLAYGRDNLTTTRAWLLRRAPDGRVTPLLSRDAALGRLRYWHDLGAVHVDGLGFVEVDAPHRVAPVAAPFIGLVPSLEVQRPWWTTEAPRLPVTNQHQLAPIVLDLDTIDLDGDGLPFSRESSLLTSDLAVDSDGDGVGDARELADGTSPTDPRDFIAREAQLRYALTPRLQLLTAWYHDPQPATWDEAPALCLPSAGGYVDATGQPLGIICPGAIAFTPELEPVTGAERWPLSPTLSVGPDGFRDADGLRTFADTLALIAPPAWASAPMGPPTLLGLDEPRGEVFIHLPHPDRWPVLRLAADGAWEQVFDAEAAGLAPLEIFRSLGDGGGFLVWSKGRGWFVLDAEYAVTAPLTLASIRSGALAFGPHQLIARRFGGAQAVLDAWNVDVRRAVELVPVDDRLRPGDVLAWSANPSGLSGLWHLREDCANDLLVDAAELHALAIAQGLPGFDTPLGLRLPTVHRLAVAPDLGELLLSTGDGLLRLSLDEGRASSLTQLLPALTPAPDMALYLGDGTIAFLVRTTTGLEVRTEDNALLASLPLPFARSRTPLAFDRVGDTFLALLAATPSSESAPRAVCFGAITASAELEAVALTTRDDLVVWATPTGELLAAPVADFCAGRATRRVYVPPAWWEATRLIPAPSGDLWHDLYRVWADAYTGFAKWQLWNVRIDAATLAVRPDGLALTAPTAGVQLPGNYGNNPHNPADAARGFYLYLVPGAWHPTAAPDSGVPVGWPRADSAMVAAVHGTTGTSALAVVPGPTAPGWGAACHLHDEARRRRDAATVTEPAPEAVEAPTPIEPGPVGAEPQAELEDAEEVRVQHDDGGCMYCGGARPVAGLIGNLLVVFALLGWRARLRHLRVRQASRNFDF